VQYGYARSFYFRHPPLPSSFLPDGGSFISNDNDDNIAVAVVIVISTNIFTQRQEQEPARAGL